MDTAMVFTIYGKEREAALEACRREIFRVEALLSATDRDSEISRINAAPGDFTEVSAETAALLRRAKDISVKTGGAFDVTVCPLTLEWGFLSGEYRVPQAAEIDALLEGIGSERILLEDSRVKIDYNQKIELGAIAKGYLTDRIFEILGEYGIDNAVVSLGGNILALGRRPDKALWRVGIEDPDKPRDFFAVLETTDTSVITSGDYQRYFEENGRRYHHIFDPQTGYPADSGLRSVTVVSRDGTLSDGLSTALFVMGAEGAREYWRNHRDFEMILVGADGKVAATPGLIGRFALVENTDYRLEFLTD